MSAGPHLDDDRLSALIDGEAAAGDVAHAGACVECAALVDAWRRASQLVAIPPVPAPAAQRDAAVGAAVDAALGAALGAAVDAPLSSVTSSREGGRGGALLDFRARPRLGGRVAAAAAAVIVVAGIATAVIHSGGSSQNGSSASKAAAGPAASASAPTVQGGVASSGPATTLEGRPPGPVSGPPSSASGFSVGQARGAILGDYADTPSLVEALRGAVAAAPASATPAATFSAAQQTAIQACFSLAQVDAKVPAGTEPVLESSLTFGGRPAQAFVFATAAGYTAAVVGAPGCGLLAYLTF